MTDDLVNGLREIASRTADTNDHVHLHLCADALTAAQARDAADKARIAELERAIDRQAAAVRTLHHNEQTEINVLRRRSSEAHCAIMALDSERAMNAILTDELEAAQSTIRNLKNGIQALKDALAQSEPKP